MRKEAAPSSVTSTTAASKLFLCFETKTLVISLLSLTLLTFLWNFPPYYQNPFFTTTTLPCSSAVSNTAVSTTSVSTTASLLSTNISLPYKTNPVAKKYISSPKPKPKDPNKRVFESHGNAAALFVQMGAYRGGPNTFSVIGLASKPIHVFGKPWFKCEWISNNGSSFRSTAYKMLPDWGYGRVYTVVVVNCTFSFNPNQDNTGGKLMVNAYYNGSPKKYEKFMALQEAPGTYNESQFNPPYKYEYLYCGSSLYGNLSADRIREWMAYHAWFFGPSSHFVFHDAGGVSPDVMKALEPWVRAGRATVQDIRDQAEYDGYYYNQFLVVNDCLHRYRYSANWTFFFDVDEYIYLPHGNSLESVMNEFSGYTQFTIQQNPMSSMLCLNDSSQQHSRQWGFEKLVFRESRKRIRRDRKYAIQAKNAYATGVHMSENFIGKSLYKTDTKIRYYHYHNTITEHLELCREFISGTAKKDVTWFDKLPYVYDDNMKKLANTIKEFEIKTIGTKPEL